MSESWIIDACRTPRGIGKKGKGALAHLHPQLHAQTLLLLQLVPILGAHTSTVPARRSWTSWWC